MMPDPESVVIETAPTITDALVLFALTFALVALVTVVIIRFLRHQVRELDRELQEDYAAWVDDRPTDRSAHSPHGDCAGCRELFLGEPRRKPQDEHRHDAWPTR